MMNEQVVSIHFQIKNMDLITAKTLIIIYHFLNLIGMINCFHFGNFSFCHRVQIIC